MSSVSWRKLTIIPHTTNLQQMTLKTISQISMKTCLRMKEQLLNKVENIVTKGDIAHFEQFLLLSQYFQKSSAAEASESICMLKTVK